MAAALRFLQENNLTDYDALAAKTTAAVDRAHALAGELQTTEAALSKVSGLMGAVADCAKARPVFDGYKATRYFKDFADQLPCVTTKEKEHGRIEKCEYYLLTDLSWLTEQSERAGLNALGMVHSRECPFRRFYCRGDYQPPVHGKAETSLGNRRSIIAPAKHQGISNHYKMRGRTLHPAYEGLTNDMLYGNISYNKSVIAGRTWRDVRAV